MRRPACYCAFAALLMLVGCAHRGPVMVPTEPTKARAKGWTEKGDASWYGEPYHGRRTASGEIYDMHEMTAAHRSLPFGTVVRVKRRDTGAEVEVRITDRGPFIKGRIIDLSFAAAKVIHLDIDGVAPVKMKVIGKSSKASSSKKTSMPAAKACFWVQIGAFGDGANARRAQKWLADDGEKVLVMEGPDGLDRVRVGPFTNEDEAKKTQKRLRAEWPAARVVECGG
ncbi:MAG: septal ring lytic transglycosylase RlpA family protein [Thermoanaerobaculales bacterium]|nr:septal ring lytic transglycosylase RlpA family protein [Thermoanaerobaculales bacterium]